MLRIFSGAVPVIVQTCKVCRDGTSDSGDKGEDKGVAGITASGHGV